MNMVSKRIMVGGIVAAVAAVTFGRLAYADNINTSANVCQPAEGWMAPDIGYGGTGVWNDAATPRDLTCAVSRSPLTTTGPANFYIDGRNTNGSTTMCTLYSYNYSGVVMSSTTFTEPVNPGNDVTWDHLVQLPSLNFYDYVGVLCTLPGVQNASPRAFLFGVTSVQ